jgi:hypothetical protein
MQQWISHRLKHGHGLSEYVKQREAAEINTEVVEVGRQGHSKTQVEMKSSIF